MAFDGFLKIAGIDGESTDDKHKNQIEILSFSWGVTQPVSGTMSSVGSISAERANFHNFSITKGIDKSSPNLFLACCSGQHLDSAVLEVCRAGGDKELYMEYKFTDVMITSVMPNGFSKGETVPSEEVSFAYGKVEWKYIPTMVHGGKGSGNVVAGWDLKTNKKV